MLRLCNTWDAAIKIVPIGDNLPWGPDLAELANARHFEFNESTNIQSVPEKEELGNFGAEESDEIPSDDDSEMMDETHAESMDEYDIDVDLLVEEFSTHLHHDN